MNWDSSRVLTQHNPHDLSVNLVSNRFVVERSVVRVSIFRLDTDLFLCLMMYSSEVLRSLSVLEFTILDVYGSFK